MTAAPVGPLASKIRPAQYAIGGRRSHKRRRWIKVKAGSSPKTTTIKWANFLTSLNPSSFRHFHAAGYLPSECNS